MPIVQQPATKEERAKLLRGNGEKGKGKRGKGEKGKEKGKEGKANKFIPQASYAGLTNRMCRGVIIST
jgi:hypothetical protein